MSIVETLPKKEMNFSKVHILETELLFVTPMHIYVEGEDDDGVAAKFNAELLQSFKWHKQQL